MTSSQDFLAVDVPAEQPRTEDVLSELVGDGKKFKSPEDLAKAKLEADKHISKIEEENAALRKKVEGLDSNYAAILAKLEEKKPTTVSATSDAAPVSKPSDLDFDTLIENRLTAREQRRIAEANMAKCKELMIAAYGDVETAKQIRDEFLKTKPYMKTALDELLTTNPDAFIKEVTSFKAPEAVGNLATDPVANLKNIQIAAEGKYITWKEANRVRREDIKRYSSPEFDKLVRESAAYYKSKGIDYYNKT